MALNITPPPGPPEGLPLSPGQRLTLRVEAPAAHGRGVARVEGFTVFVLRGLVGETVEVEVERVLSRFAVARVLNVVESAPSRVEPTCPHFDHCGGCDWQHLDYAEQVRQKQQIVSEQLQRLGGQVLPPGFTVFPAPEPYRYRDRLEFSVWRQSGGLQLGFHGLEDAAPVRITECHLAPADYSELAWSVLRGVEALLPPPEGRELEVPAPLSRITVQGTGVDSASQGLAVTLHPQGPHLVKLLEGIREPLVQRLQQSHPALTNLSVVLPRRTGSSGKRRPPTRGPRGREAGHTVWLGESFLRQSVGGLDYLVPPTGFFQVNAAIRVRLLTQVLELLYARRANLPADAPVFDLFSGSGLFALALARRGWRVAAAEADGDSVAAAQATLDAANLTNCSLTLADLSRRGAYKALLRAHGAPSAVIVDPPRRGLPRPLCEALAEKSPPVLVYVSCDGGTFARDAARLSPALNLVDLQGLDQFPQTNHVELIGVFERGT